jgi:hypothetical protein
MSRDNSILRSFEVRVVGVDAVVTQITYLSADYCRFASENKLDPRFAQGKGLVLQ